MWYVWKPAFPKWTNLCPIVFADPLGLIVVMLKATQAEPSAIDEAIDADNDLHPQTTSEGEPAGYGMLDGRVVCFDYGLPDADMVREKREYYRSTLRASGTQKNSA